MKHIKNILEQEEFEYLMLEMANIDRQRWGNEIYRISIHGPASKDRETPHIHINLNIDRPPYRKFNFEVSLIDILCYDKINLIYQEDNTKSKKVKHTNKLNCTWNGYSNIEEGLTNWLFSPSNKPGNFIDNLDVIIWTWNDENNNKFNEPNKNLLREYIEDKGLIILDKYKKYLNDYVYEGKYI